MSFPLVASVTFLGAFLIGSIPFGLIVGRAFFGTDIRSTGSGNIGAANALRAYGKAGAAAVLVLDGLKGAVPTLLAHAWLDRPLAGADSWSFATIAAFAAVIGHCYTPWLRFKGGKGVATLLGAVFAFAPLAGLAFIAIWLAAVVPTRLSSLGSLTASVLSPIVVTLMTHSSFAGTGLALAVLVIVWKHRENIARLFAGREHKLDVRGARVPR